MFFKFIKITIVVVIIIFLITLTIFFIGKKLRSKESYLQAPKNSQSIIWDTSNFTTKNKKIAFSFQFPDVGNYCNGCFDGWGAPTINFTGEWITGSYYKDDYERKWSLQVGAYLPNVKKTSDDQLFNDSISDRINKMKSLKIREKLTQKNIYTADSTITRINDVEVLGAKRKQYEINNTEGKSNYVIIELPEFTIVVSYNYYNNAVYDVLPKILNSFSLKLYDIPTAGESLKNYNNRPDMTNPKIEYHLNSRYVDKL